MKILRIALVLLCWAGVLHAHERSESTSHWTYADGDLRGVVTTRLREVTRLTVPGDSYSGLANIFAAHVQRTVEASMDGTSCDLLRAPSLLDAEPGYVRVDIRFRCRPGDRLSLKLQTFFTVAPSHHHFIYVEWGGSHREAILSVAEPEVDLEPHPGAAPQTRFPQFVRMGIEHIATGIDHIAFLLALLISARTLRQVLAIVTGFTLGHSLTLSLAVLGIVQADRGAVECLIGLTIALAAAQNLIRGEGEGRVAGPLAALITGSMLLIPAGSRPDMPATLILAVALATGGAVWLGSLRRGEFSTASRFSMAAVFGLIHGLGFAGALQDLHLPRSLLVPTLLGFNIGVELGQLLLVAGAVLLVRAVAGFAPMVRQRAEMSGALASATLLAAGLCWFLTRAAVTS